MYSCLAGSKIKPLYGSYQLPSLSTSADIREAHKGTFRASTFSRMSSSTLTDTEQKQASAKGGKQCECAKKEAANSTQAFTDAMCTRRIKSGQV